jgi:hypothetical protein
MTMQQLKKQVAELSFEKQTELTAYLVRLRNQRDPQYRRLTAKRLADADRRHWLTPDAFEKRLDRN